MITLRTTQHVFDQLAIRPFITKAEFSEVLRKVAKLAEGYTHLTDGWNGQLAVCIAVLDKPVNVGKSRGNRVILAVNMERRTIPTIFARNDWQGKPKSAAVLIDLEGNILDQ